MPTDRCGYTAANSRHPDAGAVTCWRPADRDADRCLWHRDEGAKSPDALEARRPRAGERLDGAVLRDTSLADRVWLAGTTLIGADLERANLEGATLAGANLRDADLTGVRANATRFDGAALEDATLADATLQGASFREARLDGATFSGSRIDTDTRFDDVVVYERELQEATGREATKRFDAATWVYRRLQRLARANAIFGDVERYFHREKDLRRRFAWRRREYFAALRMEGSRWLMSYGRNPWRLMAASAAVIAVCALLYPFLGSLKDTAPRTPASYALAVPPEVPAGEVLAVLGQSLYFSVVTFATLGYGDVQPVGAAARALAGLETLVGFGLIALLISVLLRRGNWL